MRLPSYCLRAIAVPAKWLTNGYKSSARGSRPSIRSYPATMNSCRERNARVIVYMMKTRQLRSHLEQGSKENMAEMIPARKPATPRGALLTWLVMMSVFTLIPGCAASTASNSPPPALSTTSVYESVLQGKRQFFSVDAAQHLHISQLCQALSADGSVETRVTKLAVVDLDSDETPEVVLGLAVNNNEDFGFEVLHYQDGVVYGYALPYRALMNLKADGTFSFSSGAADNGFGTLEFTDNGYTVHKATYCESGYSSPQEQTVSYFVDGQDATEEDFLSAIARQDQKADVLWHDLEHISLQDVTLKQLVKSASGDA